MWRAGGGGARARAICTAFRLRAAAPAAGGGGGKKKSGSSKTLAPVVPVVPIEQRVNVVLGANIYKDGSDPVIKPDSEYPEWFKDLAIPLPALSELKRRDFKSLTLPELKRLVKLDNRKKIKEQNSLRAKKKK